MYFLTTATQLETQSERDKISILPWPVAFQRSPSPKRNSIYSARNWWGNDLKFGGHIARRRIAGSYSNSMLNFLRNLYSVFHRCGTYGPWDISQPRDATLPFATTWMDLEIILLSQISLENLTTIWVHPYMDGKLRTRNERTIKTKTHRQTAVSWSAEGQRVRGEGREGLRGSINADGRGDFRWWSHNAICRWRIIEPYAWNLRHFINQCHPDTFNNNNNLKSYGFIC